MHKCIANDVGYSQAAFLCTSCVSVRKLYFCAHLQNDLEGAKAQFEEALNIERQCVEANFNLGLVHLRLEDPLVSCAPTLL